LAKNWWTVRYSCTAIADFATLVHLRGHKVGEVTYWLVDHHSTNDNVDIGSDSFASPE
jgi:hypothetical protein